ncbi:hypothetical protein G3R49_17900 [Shewanella sp. WXL01]|uniref:CsiV family protein n=1 Tax=Shewanella sp. WXL01 TaxID=2709721 RepID=UPI00143845FF|nr:hypothetical protein [Shewanella sp. WXL01]
MQPKLAMSLAAMTGLSLLCSPLTVQAKTWFEVEVFVFERQGQPNTEQWDEDAPAKPISSRAIDLISPVITTDITGVALGLAGCDSNDWLNDNPDCQQQFNSQSQKSHPGVVPVTIAAETEQTAYLGDEPLLLAQSQSQFADVITTVSKEPGVKPLLHLTWQQDMQSKRRSKPVRIFAGKDFSEEYSYHGEHVVKQPESQIEEPEVSEVNNTSQPAQFGEFGSFGSIEQTETTDSSTAHNQFGSFGQLFSLEEQTKPVWELDGTINIYLSHYLYIEHDLGLRKPTRIEQSLSDFGSLTSYGYSQEQQAGDQTNVELVPFLQTIPMKQNRRVRSGEVHYFDHPQMGIVMQIRKMEQPTTARPIDLSSSADDEVQTPPQL